MDSGKRMETRYFVLLTILLVLLTSSGAIAQIKIMPLGNSLTRGVLGPSTDDAGYRNDLSELLTTEGLTFDFVGSLADGQGFDAAHEGHDGLRAEQLRDSIATFLSASPPDMVLLQIGTNDINNGQSNASTAEEIGQVLAAIHNFNPAIKILVSSLLPRTDDKDEQVSKLNALIQQVYLEKRDAGLNVFYAGMNEIMKTNPTWKDDFFQPSDAVHPTDSGYEVVARVWVNKIMTAAHIEDDITVADNFERAALGITWDADPEFEIRDGDLVNTAGTGDDRFEFMATYKEVVSPTRVGLRWSLNADADGIGRGGLALLLDSDSRDASGFLAWITPGDNMLRLWTITKGIADQDLGLEIASQAPPPGPGDVVRVDLSVVGSILQFTYFVNNTLAGTISTPDPGNSGRRYSGVLLKHNLNNDLAEFFAEGKGDLVPPARVENLTVSGVTTTSAVLTWRASGDDGNNGSAVRYDLRYSVNPINTEVDFQTATKVAGLPAPGPAGAPETVTVFDLQPETTYYFALKVLDEAGNPSLLSNVATGTTEAGKLFTDTFDRNALGANWDAAASLQIVGDELTNTSEDQTRWDLAVLTARSNPVEVSFKWSPSVNNLGIDQGGIAVLLDAPNVNAKGYLVTRRTQRNEIRLWKILPGENPASPIVETPLLSQPEPGQEFKIRLSSDASGNHFTVFVNGQEDITITDPSFFINPRSQSDFYCGVMLAGGRKNNIDDFKALISDQPVSVDPPLAGVPGAFTLSQNYPNPFNPETRFDYELPFLSHVRIAVYNVMGQRVRTLFNGQQGTGRYTLVWNGRGDNGLQVASGVYLLRMQTGASVQVGRMQLVR
ncbi:MAG: GDSL-type esterase/lipase family protein [bacterium]